MAKLIWDATGEHFYQQGVDHGVIYVYDPKTRKYGTGVAWNGLTTVTESPSGAEPTAFYADNIKYLSLLSAEDFGATIEAYTYPDEFEVCNGAVEMGTGITVSQQPRRTFAFAYRTLLGNDLENNEYGYLIHLIYGALASPSEKSHSTVNDSPEPIQFSWTISTTPIAVPNMKPTAHLEIDSTKVDKEVLTKIENTLYGTDASEDGSVVATEPTLLLPTDIAALLPAA